MVVDTLDNLEKYVSLNPLFEEVVKFIKENDLNKLEAGKHFIKDKDLFVNITTAHGKTADEAVFETHKNMLDIQIPLDNNETMDICLLPICQKQSTTQRRMSQNIQVQRQRLM